MGSPRSLPPSLLKMSCCTDEANQISKELVKDGVARARHHVRRAYSIRITLIGTYGISSHSS